MFMFQCLVDTGSCTSAQNVLHNLHNQWGTRAQVTESPISKLFLTLLALCSEDWLSSSKYSSNRRSSAWEITSYSTSEMIWTCWNGWNQLKSSKIWPSLVSSAATPEESSNRMWHCGSLFTSNHVNSIKDPSRPAHTDWQDSCHGGCNNFVFRWCYYLCGRLHDFLLSQASLVHLYTVSNGNKRSHKEAPWLISSVSRYLSPSLSQSIRNTLRNGFYIMRWNNVKRTTTYRLPVLTGNTVRQVVLVCSSTRICNLA